MRTKILTTLAAIAIALPGCSDADGGTSAIEINKLDVGNNSTTPIDIETTRTPNSGAVREAIRIGNIVPMPFEYDNRFTLGSIFGYSQRVTPAEPPNFESAGITIDNFAQAISGYVAGWQAFGQRRAWPNLGRNIETYTIRFESADKAQFAANKLAEMSKGEVHRIDGNEKAVGKYVLSDTIASSAVHTWLAHEDMLLYFNLSDPVSRPFDLADSSAIAKNFFDKQIDMLSQYQRTPLDTISKLPLDVDGLLGRAIHDSNTSKRAAVYPAHVAASLAKRPALYSSAYSDAGVDYVAIAGTFVYRARDEAAAERLAAALGSMSQGAPGVVPADPPPNLPNAVCFEIEKAKAAEVGLVPQCRITVGRYAAQIGGTNLQDAHQRTAAQYALLSGY